MMFPMLNSLNLEFYVCYFGQLMHISEDVVKHS